MNLDAGPGMSPRDHGSPFAACVTVPRERADPILNGSTISDRLTALHEEMLADPLLAGVGRVAAALYESATDRVKTFIHATDGGGSPLGSVSVPLINTPVLKEILTDGRLRVYNDIELSLGVNTEISQKLLRKGFRSRLVVPVIHQDQPFGFLFFNAYDPGYFSESVVIALRPHIRTVSMMLVHERAMVRTMLAAVRTARAIGHHRDEESAGHLERMARYAQLIAEGLAQRHELSDEYIEYLFQYAPLHDIGKVAVPDSILMKPGKLTPEEYSVMKTHVEKGLDIVDLMQRDIGLAGLPYAELLREVVGGHHEALDGSGYPHGLVGNAIPLAARIVAVADVFDALTSRRPYKEAWSNEAATGYLKARAGQVFDPECVAELASRLDRVTDIQSRFSDSLNYVPQSDDCVV